MKPFIYLRPTAAAEAVGLLEEHGASARIIAGGQTLLLALKDRTQRPEVLVSLADIEEFAGVRADASGELVVGATTTYATLTRAPVHGWHAEIARVAGDLADRPVRTMGTVGGGLCSGEQRYDFPLLIVGVDARLEVVGPAGASVRTPAEFLTPSGATSLQSNEVLAAVRFPGAERFTGVAFEKFRQRIFDAAIVSAVCAVRVGSDGTVADASIAVGAATPAPRRCPEAEISLVGARPDTANLSDIARQAAYEVLPVGTDDVTAYRRELILSLTRRALTRALTTTGS